MLQFGMLPKPLGWTLELKERKATYTSQIDPWGSGISEASHGECLVIQMIGTYNYIDANLAGMQCK